jgi:FMN phosphatase YigB (HAD superfamily)
MITDVLKGVRASIFDVFGTVVDWRSGVAQEAGRSWRDTILEP